MYVFVHIGGYRQLAQIRPMVMESLTDGLVSLLAAGRGDRVIREEGMLIFPFDIDRDNRSKRISGLFGAYDLLRESAKRIQGFSLIVGDFPGFEGDRLFAMFKQCMYQAPVTDTLLVAPAARELLEGFLDMETVGAYSVVDTRLDTASSDIESFKSFSRRPEVFGSILDTFERLVTEEDRPDAMIIRGPRFSGRRENLLYALDTLKGSKTEIEWVEIASARHESFGLDPLIRSIRRTAMDRTTEFLNTAEKRLWEESKNMLYAFTLPGTAKVLSDNTLKDFYFAYRLYLISSVRRMNHLLVPPVIICNEISEFPKASIELLGWLFREIVETEELFPIFISAEGGLPDEFGSLRCAAVEVRPPDFDALLSESSAAILEPTDPPVRKGIVLRSSGNILSMYHALYLLSINGGTSTGGEDLRVGPTTGVAMSFDHLGKQVLFAMILADGIMGTDDIQELFSYLGTDREHLRRIIDRCIFLGLFGDPYPSILGDSELEDELEGALGEDAERIRNAVGTYLVSGAKRGGVRPSSHLESLVAGLSGVESAVDIMDSFLIAVGDAGRFPDIDAYLQNAAADAADAPVDDRRANLLSCHLLRRYIHGQDREAAGPVAETLESTAGDHGNERLRGRASLELSKYYLASGIWERSVEHAKRASMSFHGVSEDFEARAYIELGMNMMSLSRMDEAIDYFGMARDCSSGGRSPFPYIHGESMDVAVTFVHGNLSKALRSCTKAEDYCGSLKRREWQIYFLFIHGRTLFDIGRYEEAFSVFQQVLCLCELYLRDARNTVSAWLARTHIFMGNEETGLRILAGMPFSLETETFIMEGAAVAGLDTVSGWGIVIPEGRDDRASSHPTEEFFPGEVLLWEDGFMNVEGRIFRNGSKPGTLRYLHSAFAAYIAGLKGEAGEAVSKLQYIVREVKPHETDPYNNIYYYLLARALLRVGRADSLDRTTALSQAIKYVQMRGARIDEVEIRLSYMNRNHWNNRILTEAREAKLL